VSINPFASATEHLHLLRDREVSSVELLDFYIARIERYDSAINAVVTRAFDTARQRAQAADDARSRGEDAPLLGLPMTIKDCIHVAGLPTTGGVVERADAISDRDATTVARLRAAGVVIMGKTNVPPYAADYQAWNPVFGRTNNPWNQDRSPGGSSGGSAAALAAGLTPLELGGDMAGSVRQPAAFCGVYGHKTSETAVPRTGHFPGGLLPNNAVGFGVQGPMARSAEDLALALDVLAGPLEREAVAWRIELPEPRRKRLSEYRVAFLPNPDWLVLDDDIHAAVERLADGLSRAGATVGWTQPEWPGGLLRYHEVFLRIMYAFTASIPPDDRPAIAAQMRASGTIEGLAFADGLMATAQDYVGWWGEREQFVEAYRAFFSEWDVLVSPVQGLTAFPHDERPHHERTITINGVPATGESLMVHPGLCNLSGHPGTAFPVGLSREGLPTGLQAIGPYLEDRTPIHFAGLVADEFGGFVAPPGYTE